MCVVMNSHIIGVFPATLTTLVLIVMAWRTEALHPALRFFSNLALLLIIAQVGIGVATFKLHLQVEPLTVTHQAIGAALLGTLTLFTVYALRDRQATSPYPTSKLS